LRIRACHAQSGGLLPSDPAYKQARAINSAARTLIEIRFLLFFFFFSKYLNQPASRDLHSGEAKVDVSVAASIKIAQDTRCNDPIEGGRRLRRRFAPAGGMYNHVLAALRALGLLYDLATPHIPLHVT